jgi:DNA-binding NarL/FixJ family response regulator
MSGWRGISSISGLRVPQTPFFRSSSPREFPGSYWGLNVTQLILLADDSTEFRREVRKLLTPKQDWEIYAEAANGAEAVALAKALNPNLAILDISMPVQNGIQAGQQIIQFCPHAALLGISLYDPDMFIGDVIEAGFHGFVSKASICSELISAIEALLGGDSYFRLSKARRP